MASIRPLKIISGGQAGVDQCALQLARAEAKNLSENFSKPNQILTGGWMPKGWWTTEGSRPDFAKLYGMRECVVDGYPARTMMNARHAHLTIWFGNDLRSRGRLCTLNACDRFDRMFLPGSRLEGDSDESMVTAESLLRLLRVEAQAIDGEEGPMILNVAGTRQWESQGVIDCRRLMTEFFKWYRCWL